jgi:hypothetical protein
MFLCLFVIFFFFCLQSVLLNIIMNTDMKKNQSLQRRRLWQLWRAAERLVQRMQGAEGLCPGSLYLLRRQCGKPNCHCRRGALHAVWVVTRRDQGRGRLYRVPETEHARVRRLTQNYRAWQRARAALVKAMRELLRQLDALAEERLQPWPVAQPENADGPARH